MFEFPAVSPSGSDLEPKSITLMTGSAQRISVRFQRATTSQATQTDPLWPDNAWSESSSGSHTFPKMRCRPHRKNSKNKGFARWENETSSHERRESHKPLEEEERNGVMPLHHHHTQDAKVSTVLFLCTVIYFQAEFRKLSLTVIKTRFLSNDLERSPSVHIILYNIIQDNRIELFLLAYIESVNLKTSIVQYLYTER